jgi:hypothetical protein
MARHPREAVRRLSLLIAVLAVLAVPAAADARVPSRWLGVVADGPMTSPGFPAAGEWARMAASGAESVRTAFPWSELQPAPGAAPDFAGTDRTVLAAAAHGLGVLPILIGTPAWAALHPRDPASPPRDPAALAALIPALVARYGPRGSFWSQHPEVRGRPIRAWQIWNEPNLTRYWNAPGWARGYVALVKAAHRALRRADPGSSTVLAGLPNRSWLALRAIYRRGARGSFDVVALHPYTGRPSNVIRLVRFARREMRRAHDRKRPVWVTELSWPAAQGKTHGIPGFDTTDRGQAARLRQGIELLARNRRALKIGRVYWYTWLSAEGGPNSFAYSGLRRLRAGRVVSAPALAAFRAVARRLER